LDLTSEATSVYYYVLDWGEGRTNTPDPRDDAPLTSLHLDAPDEVEGGQ